MLAIAQLLAANFPHSRFLGAPATAALLTRLESSGIAGGSVYDAMGGAAAAEHGLTLATRDQRVLDTYRILDVRLDVLT